MYKKKKKKKTRKEIETVKHNLPLC
jgi:hypothetical protein